MITNPYSLSGKQILVTGASSGIGRAVAIACALLDANVILTGRNEERLREVYSSLEGTGHQMIICDQNNEEQMTSLVKQITLLDGVVYCAGTLLSVPAKLIQRNDLDVVFETNYFSTVHLNTLIMKNKRLKRGASVVFISSIAAGWVADMGNAIYSSSKAALSAYARVVALELSGRRIRVNCVAPGMVRTPFLKNFSVDEEQFLEDEKKYPLGYGEPSDVAYAVTYLLSDVARWITGTSLLLDGGLTLN